MIEKDGCFFKITGNNTLTPATLNGMAITLASKQDIAGFVMCYIKEYSTCLNDNFFLYPPNSVFDLYRGVHSVGCRIRFVYKGVHLP